MSCIAYTCFWIEFVINCLKRRRRRRTRSMKMKLQFIYDDLDIDHSLYINVIIAVKFAAICFHFLFDCFAVFVYDGTVSELLFHSYIRHLNKWVYLSVKTNWIILSFKFITHPEFELCAATPCPRSRCHFKSI